MGKAVGESGLERWVVSHQGFFQQLHCISTVLGKVLEGSNFVLFFLNGPESLYNKAK